MESNNPNEQSVITKAGWLHNRRHFLLGGGVSIAAAAMNSLFAADNAPTQKAPHFPAKAKRVIYLCQSGAPSQIDLYDHKPKLEQWVGDDLPDSVRNGQRLTGMTAGQASFPIAPSIFDFKQYGQSGAWVSELLPHTSGIVDDVTFIRTLYTEAINHDPAITLMQTGTQIAGRPSFGAWLSYGLGSLNDDLPTFIAMTSGEGGQPLYDRCLLYTSPSPRDKRQSRMPSSA